MPEGIRINRYLARSGLGSRRKVEEFIKAGEVFVNGEVIRDLFYRVREGDQVVFRGSPVVFPETFTYIAMNKPPGYVVSRRTGMEEEGIFVLLGDEAREDRGLLYAGRLDKMSRGLLLLSNDGEFIQRMTHPTHKLPRHYYLRLRAFIRLEAKAVERSFLEGIEDDGEILKAIRLNLRPQGSNTFLMDVSLESGRKRQLRRMCDQIGFEVLDLQRYGIGRLYLDDLKIEEGKWRCLTPAELGLLVK